MPTISDTPNTPDAPATDYFDTLDLPAARALLRQQQQRIAEQQDVANTLYQSIARQEEEIESAARFIEDYQRLQRENAALRHDIRSYTEAEQQHQQFMRLPSTHLSPTDKLVFEWVIREIRSAQSRHGILPGETLHKEDGSVLLNIQLCAGDLGISTDTVSKSVKRLTACGLWERKHRNASHSITVVNPVTGEERKITPKRLWLLPNEDALADPATAIIAAQQQGEVSARNWGGKRPVCEHCGSANVELHRICLDCGAVDVVRDRDTQDEAQDAQEAGSGTTAPAAEATTLWEPPYPHLAAIENDPSSHDLYMASISMPHLAAMVKIADSHGRATATTATLSPPAAAGADTCPNCGGVTYINPLGAHTCRACLTTFTSSPANRGDPADRGDLGHATRKAG